MGAWAIGYPPPGGESPRVPEPTAAAEIGAALKRRFEIVGVFVNPRLDEVDAAVENAELTMVQLHGDEGPSFCGEVARRTGAKVIKALRVRSAAEVRRRGVPDRLPPPRRLSARDPGGTGESFDWELLAARRSRSR